jgi:glycosyltransferase involved in cell wall biosynthesis
MMKKLSVLVPSYNFASYITDCINSIYKQKTNFEFDVIVRDDGSNDNTKDILNDLKRVYPNLVVLDGSVNLGAFENIKLLYKSANSEYVAYLDGDDLFGDDDKLQKQVEFLDENLDYVMSFTGCRYLYEDGKIHPDDSRVICGVKDIVTTEDLIEKNYVGFGKVFRNTPNILKEKYSNLPYVDWPMAYELSKYGLIAYQDFFGGLYRISDDGAYSKIPKEEKVKGFNLVRNTIREDYFEEKYKTLTIIDSFVSNNSVLLKLKESISKLKRHGNKILLVSNTVPPDEVIKTVDYFLYNHENKLFSQNFDDINYCDLWKDFPQITIHEISEEFQKHGLSVLSNIFNCLDLAKSLGYTHFQRLEVDDLYSEKGCEYMKTVPKLCSEKNKKSLFYFNEGKDVSFHYFYSEIDFFFKNFPRVDSEESYKEFLKNSGFGKSFKPVEIYLYHNLKNGDLNNVLIKNGEHEMNSDFEGTIWNTETSQSTLHHKYEGCSTKIYNVSESNSVGVVSYNYNNYSVKRKIVVILKDRVETIYHHLDYFDAWAYNIFDNDLVKILVYDAETNRLLYESENKDIKDYIELK